MPSRCSTLKGKVSSRLICKSPLLSFGFSFRKGSGDEGAGVGSSWVASPLRPELSQLKLCPPRSQEATALPSSAISSCPFPSLGLSVPISVWKITKRSPGEGFPVVRGVGVEAILEG